LEQPACSLGRVWIAGDRTIAVGYAILPFNYDLESAASKESSRISSSMCPIEGAALA
jgi:hypothetical protein